MPDTSEKKVYRFWTPQFVIGVGITLIAVIGVFWLSAKSINCGDCQNEDQIKYVLGVVLPLLGTWVGTVLAFYFSKDNFESANRSVESLVDRVTTSAEKLKSIIVKEVMILKNQISGFDYEKGKKDSDYTVTQLLDKVNETGRNRLPIFNADASIRYIVHRSILDKYVSTNLSDDKTGPLATTISTLLKDANYKTLFTAFEVVAEEDTLAIAKRMMDSKPNSLDVFVTKDGSKTAPVTGWITNLVIAENSKV